MAFDLANHPMTGLNSALISTLHDVGIHEGYIEQNAADAVLIFKPNGRITTGAAMVAVHALLAEKGVAVVSTDEDRMGMVRIVFARADDGTLTPPAAKASHDAIVDDWFLAEVGSFSVLMGTVREDSKGRWPDGTFIRTSPLQTDAVAEDGVVVRTLRTSYLLGRQRREDELTVEEKLSRLLVSRPPVAITVCG